MTVHGTLRIRKIGRSAVLVIPMQLLRRLKLSADPKLIAIQTPNGVLLRSKRRGRRSRPLGLPSDASTLTNVQSEALDQRLKAFDPSRHGGEAMTVRPVDREIR